MVIFSSIACLSFAMYIEFIGNWVKIGFWSIIDLNYLFNGVFKLANSFYLSYGILMLWWMLRSVPGISTTLSI